MKLWWCFNHHDYLRHKAYEQNWALIILWNLFHSSCWHVYLPTYSTLFLLRGGYAVVHLVEALCYKPEGCRFDSRWCHWYFWHNSSGHNMALRGKGGRCTGPTTFPPSYADYLEIWEPQRPGTLWACNGIAFISPTWEQKKIVIVWNCLHCMCMLSLFHGNACTKKFVFIQIFWVGSELLATPKYLIMVIFHNWNHVWVYRNSLTTVDSANNELYSHLITFN